VRWKHFKIAREKMVREQLHERGIGDIRVMHTMMSVPRHIFLDGHAGSEAYADHSFPIGYSQTMSQPFMVAYMAEHLELEGEERILEIGTGSGYNAAVLANLAREVYTIERIPELADRAMACLRDLLYANVHVRVGDGSEGWSEEAPFDRIMMTAATRQVPKMLMMQLSDGGVFLGPIEKEDRTQEIVKVRRSGNQFNLERLSSCSFVPLIRDGNAQDVDVIDPTMGASRD